MIQSEREASACNRRFGLASLRFAENMYVNSDWFIKARICLSHYKLNKRPQSKNLITFDSGP